MILDLSAAWEHHVGLTLEDRNPRRIAASDIHGCAYSFHQRYNGAEQLPYESSSFSAFERGHAYETRVFEAVDHYIRATHPGWLAERGGTIEYGGIEGHPDILVYDENGVVVLVIDPSTTASKFGDWKYGHALKTAFYADFYKCEDFAELVICCGFGGNILSVTPHYFKLGDTPELKDGLTLTWRQRVHAHAKAVKAVSVAQDAPNPPTPPFDPIDGEIESWRCGKPGSGKSYCRTICPLNARLSPMKGDK